MYFVQKGNFFLLEYARNTKGNIAWSMFASTTYLQVLCASKKGKNICREDTFFGPIKYTEQKVKWEFFSVG